MSKEISVIRTIGNFKYTAKFSLTPEVEDVLLAEGITRVLQGPVATTWEKAILNRLYPNVKRGDIKVKDAETGEDRAFKRTDIPFSVDDAEAWKREVMGAEVETSENEKGEGVKTDLGATEVTVEEYTGSAGVVPKYAAEKSLVREYLVANGGKLKDGTPRTVETFAANRGITPLPQDATKWEEDIAFLTGVKAFIAAEKAKQAAQE